MRGFVDLVFHHIDVDEQCRLKGCNGRLHLVQHFEVVLVNSVTLQYLLGTD